MAKKYDVYGIGNALVDIDFEVSQDFLSDHNIKKGLMTLVDEETQTRLIKAIDGKNTEKKSGGSAANTVMAVSQFGGSAFYSCKVADDEFGQFYLNDLTEAGIATNLDGKTKEHGITGKCLVMITDDADRTMNTFLGITTSLSTSEVSEEAIQNSEYIYLEGYLVASPTAFEAMKLTKQLAEKNGVKTSITLSDPSIVEGFKGLFHEVIGDGVDLLFCNEDEALKFTGSSNINVAREELKKFAKKFVITQGKNGAMIFDGDTFIDIEPYQVNTVDTNGAGDMFAGAFLYGITNGHSYAGSGKLASLASSKIVSQYGPRLPMKSIKEIQNQIS
ncbi:MAG TPA: adenosine kinase [Balneola sp.]|jgi:sugar/nucleoside kinase (ribokinase family)|nr:adenosine kinase [Balneola sp.]MAO78594.1 adenosine kinase [Balneola sp.]MBF63177.1 adenosine kinase [Balneola sp.]HAH51235.1 adenosine kinase [Balneola sp.]HAW81853.1 adenosine kinase [Balneola sp.]|tara:strand:- start:4354 stop:5349 length:996 start_codon:yes stop_codon:yes gene_type:complete